MGRRGVTPAATLALAMAVACGGATTSSERSSASASASTAAPTLPILRHVRTGAGPIGITSAFGSVWIVNSEFRVRDRGSVTRIDPANGSVLATVRVGGVPLEVSAAAGLAEYSFFRSFDNGAPQHCTGGTGYNSWYGHGQVNALSAIDH